MGGRCIAGAGRFIIWATIPQLNITLPTYPFSAFSGWRDTTTYDICNFLGFLGTGHDIGRRVALLGLRFTLFCFVFVPSPFVRRLLIFEIFERLISDSAKGSWLLRGRFSEALYFFLRYLTGSALSLSPFLLGSISPVRSILEYLTLALYRGRRRTFAWNLPR